LYQDQFIYALTAKLSASASADRPGGLYLVLKLLNTTDYSLTVSVAGHRRSLAAASVVRGVLATVDVQSAAEDATVLRLRLQPGASWARPSFCTQSQLGCSRVDIVVPAPPPAPVDDSPERRKILIAVVVAPVLGGLLLLSLLALAVRWRLRANAAAGKADAAALAWAQQLHAAKLAETEAEQTDVAATRAELLMRHARANVPAIGEATPTPTPSSFTPVQPRVSARAAWAAAPSPAPAAATMDLPDWMNEKAAAPKQESAFF